MVLAVNFDHLVIMVSGRRNQVGIKCQRRPGGIRLEIGEHLRALGISPLPIRIGNVRVIRIRKPNSLRIGIRPRAIDKFQQVLLLGRWVSVAIKLRERLLFGFGRLGLLEVLDILRVHRRGWRWPPGATHSWAWRNAGVRCLGCNVGARKDACQDD